MVRGGQSLAATGDGANGTPMADSARREVRLRSDEQSVLCFLAEALVAAEGRDTEYLTDIVALALREFPSGRGSLRGVLEALKSGLIEVARPSTTADLIAAAERLVRDQKPEAVTAGRALASALE